MRKLMTPSQAETSKGRAERFVRHVLEDDERADEIADESVEDFADRKGIELVENPHNPHRRTATMAGQTRADLQERIAELEEENEALQEKLSSIGEILDESDEDESDEDDEEEEE